MDRPRNDGWGTPRALGSNQDTLDCAPTQMSWDELELLLLLYPGDKAEAKDKRTGQLWRGVVDITAPEQGKLWLFVELGERKLFDIEVHSISRID